MKKTIKMICIDMDGTLLNSKHEVSERNKNALKKAQEIGIKLAVTTGRLFCSARYYSDLIGIDAPVIASNGAYIKDKYEDEAILECPIPKDMIADIYKIIKKHGLIVTSNSWNTFLRDAEIPEGHPYKTMNRALPEGKKVNFIVNEDLISAINEYEGNLLKVIVIEEEDKERLWRAKEELKAVYKDKLHIVSSGTNNFEVMIGNASKGNAVAYLADSLHIPSEEIMCIGDSENDISMLKFAGVGVAMGNGLQMVKDAADYVTDTNNNDGVAKAIEKFVFGEDV